MNSTIPPPGIWRFWEQYGDNRLTEQASESFWDKLKGNFGDPMIKIL